MKVPAKIPVLGEDIRIIYIDEIAGEPTEFIHGDYNPDKNIIRLRKQDPESMARTLMHEIGHALLTKSGWAQALGESTEEALCILLEQLSLIYCLRTDNRRLTWKRDSQNT